jgi:four helix bundle protein
MNRQVLEDRLISFAADVDTICTKDQGIRNRPHIAEQLQRSSSSAMLNYAEAQSAASQKDFIHKCNLVLKELRETLVGLKFLARLSADSNRFSGLLKESDELVRIFHSTVRTGRINYNRLK